MGVCIMVCSIIVIFLGYIMDEAKDDLFKKERLY